jgi:co-chaperonin GroES (HSP10)
MVSSKSEVAVQNGQPKFGYRPNGTYVLLQPVGSTERNVGGILVPGGSKMTWLTAVVLEVGSKCEFAKQGDRVVVAHEGMVKVQHDNAVPVYFTLEDKILAVVSTTWGV